MADFPLLLEPADLAARLPFADNDKVLIVEQAKAENFIAIYPQGVPLDGSAHWNSLMNAEGNKSETDDIGFVSSLLSLMSTTATEE